MKTTSFAQKILFFIILVLLFKNTKARGEFLTDSEKMDKYGISII